MAKKIEIPANWPQWKREIAERINQIGSSMKQASQEAGLGETWVRDALKRDKEPTLRNLQKLRQTIGLEVVPRNDVEISGLEVIGRVQAGAFLDISVFDEDHERPIIPAPKDPNFPKAHQYALEVVGDSMNKLFDEGSFVICVDWADTGLRYRAGMCLHVERHQGPLVEVTVKRLASMDGRLILEPCSSNQAHKPIEIDDHVIVKGLVTGAWKPIVY